MASALVSLALYEMGEKLFGHQTEFLNVDIFRHMAFLAKANFGAL